MWITVASGRNVVDGQFIKHVRAILHRVVAHAKLYWTKNDDELLAIEMTKLDVAVDLSGSFFA